MENEKELKNIDVVSKFSKFEVINKDFTRCRCNVFYTGRNRNYSDITEDALRKFIARKGYANVPVVAHLMKDDDGNYRVGGHDGKIVISNDGIEFVDECVPFGVIPEDCNPSMDEIVEQSGEVKKYFSVDLILWTHRYPIMEAAYGDEVYFNQSMEINFDDYSYDGPYIVVNDFSMSALCLLNKSNSSSENVEPCFESSRVKKFSVDESTFKENFNELLTAIKKYELDSNGSVQDKTNTNKEGEQQMDYMKFVETLSQVKVGDSENCKYVLLNVTDEKVNVIDTEDYKAYAFDYAVTSENDAEELVINYDSKREMSLSACEKIEDENFTEFSIMDAINAQAEEKLNAYTEKLTGEFNVKFDEIKQEYESLNEEYKNALTELNEFRASDAARKEQEHKDNVDNIVSEFAKKLQRVPEFLVYKARLDYSKTEDEIRQELTLMAGKNVMDSQTKANFAYNPVSTKFDSKNNENKTTSRYGNLLDKFLK